MQWLQMSLISSISLGSEVMFLDVHTMKKGGGGIGRVVSLGNTDLNIKHTQYKTGQGKVFRGVMVSFWHTTPVVNVLMEFGRNFYFMWQQFAFGNRQ